MNSGGKPAIEIELQLNNGCIGIASCPSAIIPGIREKKKTCIDELEDEIVINTIRQIYNIRNINQEKLDQFLNFNINRLGSDITLSISLAYARAAANKQKSSLVTYVVNLLKTSINNSVPYPLIGIFSGGVHNNTNKNSFQQIMISINTSDFQNAVNIILDIYISIEQYLKENDMYVELGNSSGFVVKNLSTIDQFLLLAKVIEDLDYKHIVSIAVDVAAEHLWHDESYNFENKKYNADEFYDLIQDYIERFKIELIEDPFESTHELCWQRLKNQNPNLMVIGDDLFATQAEYINSSYANGIIIKMNQTGTLTKTIEAIKEARRKNMKLCISHRSLETEDTFICDLAVAVNSEYIKIGGPRRNDRIAKYNRLLKIQESINK